MFSPHEFYIELDQNRYFEPGDTITGSVVVDYNKPTKIKHIRVTLTGTFVLDNERQPFLSKETLVAENPTSPGKSHYLEARNNRFPFSFQLPTAEMPSSMKMQRGNGVFYALEATLERGPWGLDVFPWKKAKRDISVLENVDVGSPEYSNGSGNIQTEVPSSIAHERRKARVTSGLPKFAIVRGDVLPVTVTIQHYKLLRRTGAIKVSLERHVFKLAKGASASLAEKMTVKQETHDILVNNQNGYAQTTVAKLLVPPSAPPTTKARNTLLKVKYFVHVTVDLRENVTEPVESSKRGIVDFELPVIVGTSPPVEFYIDDEEPCDSETQLVDNTDSESNSDGRLGELSAALENLGVDKADDHVAVDNGTHMQSRDASPRGAPVGSATQQTQHDSTLSRSSSGSSERYTSRAPASLQRQGTHSTTVSRGSVSSTPTISHSPSLSSTTSFTSSPQLMQEHVNPDRYVTPSNANLSGGRKRLSTMYPPSTVADYESEQSSFCSSPETTSMAMPMTMPMPVPRQPARPVQQQQYRDYNQSGPYPSYPPANPPLMTMPMPMPVPAPGGQTSWNTPSNGHAYPPQMTYIPPYPPQSTTTNATSASHLPYPTYHPPPTHQHLNMHNPSSMYPQHQPTGPYPPWS